MSDIHIKDFLPPCVYNWALSKRNSLLTPCTPYFWKEPGKPTAIFFTAVILTGILDRASAPDKKSEPSSIFNKTMKVACVASAILAMHAVASFVPSLMKRVAR